MIALKCKICGGDLSLDETRNIGHCQFCNCIVTIPSTLDDQNVNLFNRANHFRLQGEYDKSISAFEKILERDEHNAEAHWGVVLSRYGIEYVDDPISHQRIPTCHRLYTTSVLADYDYLAAVENAPNEETRGIYQAEAARIAELQKNILAISQKEEPYDIFICYKEKDDSDNRTQDSVLAQEIYYHLTDQGYKVFFSRISLENKLGQEYEPYIFAALNSAKIMITLGTKPEHFNAVWVRNEWSRFLVLMKNDKARILIPCYRDMSPYDLPEELSIFQGQDMARIGFIQDLLHGINKLMSDAHEQTKTTVVEEPITADAHVIDWIKRSMAAELAECEEDIEQKEQSIAEKEDELSKISWYRKKQKRLEIEWEIYDLQLEIDRIKSRYDSIQAKYLYILDDPEERKKWAALYLRKEEMYKEAQRLYKQEEYLQAYEIFSELEDYSDSIEKAKESYASYQEAVYQHALKLQSRKQWADALQLYISIGDYCDSRARAEKCIRKNGNNNYSKKSTSLEHDYVASWQDIEEDSSAKPQFSKTLRKAIVSSLVVLGGLTLLNAAISIDSRGENSTGQEFMGCLLLIANAVFLKRRQASILEYIISAAGGIATFYSGYYLHNGSFSTLSGGLVVIISTINLLRQLSS